ncbi:MAG: ankyrin repeat domain-containing protein [Candidatus Babeliales bacterium]
MNKLSILVGACFVCTAYSSELSNELSQLNQQLTQLTEQLEDIEMAPLREEIMPFIFQKQPIPQELITKIKNTGLYNELEIALLEGNTQTVKDLIAKTPTMVNTPGDKGGTPLMLAAVLGNLEMVNLLIANKADVNATSGDGMTALLAATWLNHNDIVKILLTAGADPNIQSGGMTALLVASFTINLEGVKTLLEHNADPSLKNNNEYTALDLVQDDATKQKKELTNMGLPAEEVEKRIQNKPEIIKLLQEALQKHQK